MTWCVILKPYNYTSERRETNRITCKFPLGVTTLRCNNPYHPYRSYELLRLQGYYIFVLYKYSS